LEDGAPVAGDEAEGGICAEVEGVRVDQQGERLCERRGQGGGVRGVREVVGRRIRRRIVLHPHKVVVVRMWHRS
jgi:hypothetical protein